VRANLHDLFTRIRNWLIINLSGGIRDEKLVEYGYNPLDDKSYPVPEPVTNLSVVWLPDDKLVKLSWSATVNAKDYEGFVAPKSSDPDANPVFKRFGKTKHLFIHYSKAVSGKKYLFQVRGVKHFMQGEFSNVVEITIP
jgi:hypothetical protein